MERGVVCEVTPIGLLAYFVKVFSLTELTDLTEPFCALFRSHRTPPAYRVHRTFQLLSLLIRDITKPTFSPQGYLGDHSPSLRGRGRGRGQLVVGM